MEQVGGPQLLQEVGPVVAGAAVHRQAHGNPQSQHAGHPAHAGGQLHVGDRAVGHAGARVRQAFQLLVVEVDAVGVPHVRAHPAHVLHVGQGPPAVLFQHVMLLVLRLAQVGVEPQAQTPGQGGGLAVQRLAGAEGRAGGQGHGPHRVEGGVVILLRRRLGVPQNLVHGLDHAVRGQAAVFFAQVHAAPGGRHADPQVPGGGKLGVQQGGGGPAGEDVVVVEDGGAAGFQQFSHAHQGAVVDRLAVQVLPDLIQGPQPVEELQVLHLGQVPAEGLVEVVVGVDQAGVDGAAPGVQGLLRLRGLRAHVSDHAVPDEDGDVFQYRIPAVAGDGGRRVFN